MRIAQQLYEGVEIKGQGTVGLITYLRTDSTRISAEADAAAREYIEEHYGKEFLAEEGKTAEKKQNIQDAHEAIRPTDVTRTPASLKGIVSNDQYKLYKLIYERFLASRMQPAVYDTFAVTVTAGDAKMRASTSSLAFPGFLNVYNTEEENDDTNVFNFSGIDQGDKLQLKDAEPKQHFTEPPAHYTEASLVRAMEENGIGRPSTYAPTISTLLNRRYVTKEQKNLYITELGSAVNTIMVTAFPEIVNIEFTANMESLLDSIGDGIVDWKVVVRNFYPDLEAEIRDAENSLSKVKIADEKTDEICEKCGSNMVIKYGSYGKFLACPNFPECRNTMPYFEKIGVKCPDCGKDLVKKTSKKGRTYYGCSGFPDCEYMSWARPVDKKCPKCHKLLIIKGKKLVCSDPACGYKEQIENS